MKFIDIEPGSEAWHEYRRFHANASEADIIMNCAPAWKSPRTWHELDLYKKGKLSVKTNSSMQHGIDLEPKARALAERLLGCPLKPVVVEEDGKSQVPLSASLDAYGEYPDGRTVKVEIKCPKSADSKVWANELIPDYYQWQMIHQDLVCPTDETYFMVYLDDERYRLPRFVSLPAGQAQLLEQWEKWWFGEIEPDWIDADLPQGASYLALKARLDRAKTSFELAEEALKQAARQLGPKVRTPELEIQTLTRKGSVDYKKIPELKGVNLDKYRGKTTEYITVRERKI